MVIIHKKQKETKEEKEARLKKEQEQSMGVQDEYQARGFELVSWVQEHKGLVSGAIVLLLLAGGSFSAYLYYNDRKAEAASSLFLESLKTLEGDDEAVPLAEKMKKAEEGFQKVNEHYPSSKVATLANLYRAHLALENGQTEDSVKLYQKVVTALGKSNSLYPSAVIGLGYAQEKSGDTKGALSSFESVVALKDAAGKDLALFESARLVKDQSADKAKEYISMLLEQYPQSVYEKQAIRLRESLQ